LTNYFVVGTLSSSVVFFALLLAGFGFGTLKFWQAAAFLVLWFVGYLSLRYFLLGGYTGAFLFVPYVVLLDAVLMVAIFREVDKLS
jgi:hypothetical protein